MELPITTMCLKQALGTYSSYFQAPPITLHRPRTMSCHPDLRLQDYLCVQSSIFSCFTEVIRAVLAARHVSYHFYAERAAQNVFHGDVNTTLLQRIVLDGRRFAWLEERCQNFYISFIVACYWARFRHMADDELLAVARKFLRSTVAVGSMSKYAPTWPQDLFAAYHSQ